jgi:hypothetical protein
MEALANNPVQLKKINKIGKRITGANFVKTAHENAIQPKVNRFCEKLHHINIRKKSSINSGFAATENA